VLRRDTLLAAAHARELAALFEFFDGRCQGTSLLGCRSFHGGSRLVNRALEVSRCAHEMLRSDTIRRRGTTDWRLLHRTIVILALTLIKVTEPQS
jgi:hypothetical protein